VDFGGDPLRILGGGTDGFGASGGVGLDHSRGLLGRARTGLW
jgi:hypothetical protein